MDPTRLLVRCLCGVVVERWEQVERSRMPRKSWLTHTMEVVGALTAMLEQATPCNLGPPATETARSPGAAVATRAGGGAQSLGDAADAEVRLGGIEGSPAQTWLTEADLQRLLDALVQLMLLNEGAPSTPKGLRLSCAMALVRLGLAGGGRVIPGMDARQRVELLDATHEHLATGSGGGEGGICADGGGVFLRTALDYLSGPE
ncbi:unnamed protein product, partial [Discosporangium mesarthrocarpum]